MARITLNQWKTDIRKRYRDLRQGVKADLTEYNHDIDTPSTAGLIAEMRQLKVIAKQLGVNIKD